MIRFLTTLMCIGVLHAADDLPEWCLPSVMWCETGSYYKSDGSIHYTNKRRGTHGERSAFQITKAAFNQVRKHGEQFWMIETDQAFAEIIATRYMYWLHKPGEDWLLTCEHWNAGPGKRSAEYRRKIQVVVDMIKD